MTATLPDPAASRAVLIGVDTCTEPLRPLPTMANNLTGLKKLLTGPHSGSLPPRHCTVLRNPDSATQVLDAVHVAATEATDALFVYFAGHGLLSPAGELYLALSDSPPGRLFRAVDYNQLRIAVPEGCADRTVHWWLTADGKHHIGEATSQWLRQYDETRTPRLHDIRPRTLTIEAWWNGGDTTCPSFSLTWRDPKLLFEVDADFLDRDYYP